MYFRVKHFDKYVGAFILFFIIAFAIALVFIGRGQRWFEKRYTFVTVFDSVSGIEPGAKVILSGMPIGAVKDIRLNRNNMVEITLSILDTYRDSIRIDSVARISCPIIGSKVMEISIGSLSQPPLPEGGVVKSKETREISDIVADIDFKSSMEKLTETLDNIKTITENLIKESKAIATNLREITEKMSKSVGEITGNVEEITIDISRATKSLAETLGNMESITGEIDAGKGNLGAVIKGRELYDNVMETTVMLKKTAQNMERASSDMCKLVKDVSGGVKDIKRSIGNIPQIVNTGQESMEDARKIMKSVEKIWPISAHIKEPEPIGSISINGREGPHK